MWRAYLAGILATVERPRLVSVPRISGAKILVWAPPVMTRETGRSTLARKFPKPLLGRRLVSTSRSPKPVLRALRRPDPDSRQGPGRTLTLTVQARCSGTSGTCPRYSGLVGGLGISNGSHALFQFPHTPPIASSTLISPRATPEIAQDTSPLQDLRTDDPRWRLD